MVNPSNATDVVQRLLAARRELELANFGRSSSVYLCARDRYEELEAEAEGLGLSIASTDMNRQSHLRAMAAINTN